MQGPNVRRLVASKMSTDAVPSGCGIAAAVAFLTDPQKIKSGAAKATEWVNAAMRAIREAGEPNQWKGADDEAIAGMLLNRIEEKKGHRVQAQ
jgi:hypothetical protein